jgi:hypothetical protein
MISLRKLEAALGHEAMRLQQQDLLTDYVRGMMQGLKIAGCIAVAIWDDQKRGYPRHTNGARKKAV